jgi:hypothetical protein
MLYDPENNCYLAQCYALGLLAFSQDPDAAYLYARRAAHMVFRSAEWQDDQMRQQYAGIVRESGRGELREGWYFSASGLRHGPFLTQHAAQKVRAAIE